MGLKVSGFVWSLGLTDLVVKFMSASSGPSGSLIESWMRIFERGTLLTVSISFLLGFRFRVFGFIFRVPLVRFFLAYVVSVALCFSLWLFRGFVCAFFGDFCFQDVRAV